MQIPIRTFHRLLSILQVNNTKPSKPKSNLATTKRAFTVWPSMFNGFHHSLDHSLLVIPVTGKSTDTAHIFLRI